MTDRREKLALPDEPLDEGFVLPRLRGERLDGNHAVQYRVERAVDHTHSALAEEVLEFVDLADGILPGRFQDPARTMVIRSLQRGNLAFQDLDHLGNLGPVGGLLGEHLPENAHQARVPGIGLQVFQGGRLVEVHQSYRQGWIIRLAGKLERQFSRKELPEHHSDRVDVGLSGDLGFPETLLRGHVMGGSHHDSGSRLLFVGPGDPEIDDLDLPFLVHQDVGGLDIPVDDLFLVAGVDSAKELQELHEEKGPVLPILRSKRVDALSVDELHDEKGDLHFLVHLGCEDGDDGWMVDGGEDPPFVQKTLGEFGSLGGVFEQELDRDLPAQVVVESLEHLAHSARSEPAQDLVMTSDDLVVPDHDPDSLRQWIWFVKPFGKLVLSRFVESLAFEGTAPGT